MITPETYTLGYEPAAIKFVGVRRAQTHAAFLLPSLRPGMRLLDCGCGPGSISLDFARLIEPGEVIGIDREESQLDLARQAASKQTISNAHFESASIYNLPYSNDSFDAAFAHALFEHLKEPERALRELHRVLKPGGIVALRSPDWGGFLITPETAPVREAVEYFKFLQREHGGDVHVGRKLKGLLLASGFSPVALTGSYECCDPLTYITNILVARIESSLVRDRAVERGWITIEKVREMVAGLDEFSREPAGFFGIAWCEAIGRK